MKHKVWFRYWFQTFFSVSQSQILYSFFLLYVQIEDYQNILKLRQWSLSCTSYKAFLKKKKKGFELFYLIFRIVFQAKYFSCYILLMDWISWVDCFYFLRYWAICVTSQIFELGFFIKPFSYMAKKVMTKIQIS